MPAARLRILSLLFIIGLIPALLGLEPAAPVRAQGSAEGTFQSALDAYNIANGSSLGIALLGQDGPFAYATAMPADPGPAGEHIVLLADARSGQGWQVWVPGESDPTGYNALLDAFPEYMIDPVTKETLRQPEAPGGSAGPAAASSGNYTGHRLPWPYGQAGYVTQKDTAYHMYQIDFDIRGLAASGDVYASKPGMVVFVKDSSGTTCQTPSPDPCWKKSNMVVVQHDSGEYTWYLHIARGSAAVSAGQRIGYGTKLGVEGETGYSFGVHLHFMASSGHTAWTDPKNPDDAPWGLGISTQVDFDEYPWSALVQTYTSTYTSQNGANLKPVCPGGGGVLLYRDKSYGCAGLLENFGYTFSGAAGLQNLGVSFNDTASSIRVPGGWSVMLYENASRGGGKLCKNESDSDFSDDTFSNQSAVENRVSSFEVFSAPGCPRQAAADLTAPTGSITSPAAGETAGRFLHLAAQAKDASSGVRMVRFDATWGGVTRQIAAISSAPYEYQWDLCASGEVPDGEITVQAAITDNTWNSYTTPAVTVTKQYTCAQIPAGNWTARYWANPTLTGEAALESQESAPLLFKDWGTTGPGTGIPGEGWSARFTRVFAFEGGPYTFHCAAAGGCVLSINGQERTLTAGSWSGTLNAGEHEISVTYTNTSGPAALSAWWEGAGFLPTQQPCTEGQWCLNAWANTALAGAPILTRNAGEELRLDWGEAGPDPLLPADGFSTRAERSTLLDCGAYQFHLDTPDAVRLWLDGALLIDSWAEPAPAEGLTGEASVERGEHLLRVEQADASGRAGLGLSLTKTGGCQVSAEVASASTHYVRPGAVLEPSVSVSLTAGELDPARGDGLYFLSGRLLGAAASQPARRLVAAGETYTFDTSNGLRMTAPQTPGSYTSRWEVRASGQAVSTAATIRVLVDAAAPEITYSGPGSQVRTSSIAIKPAISDAISGVSHVQFLAGYSASGGWAWRHLGYDMDGSNGWSYTWNAASIADQKGIAIEVVAWDWAGNSTEAVVEGITLDRTPPAVTVTTPGTPQDTTRFQVQWSGSDKLTGIKSYDIQVRVDGGAPQNWLSSVPAATRSAWFTGELGHSYAFQARATDGAGNASAYTSASAATPIKICMPDGLENNNEAGFASILSPGDPARSGNFCMAGDVDWFAVEVTAGTEYIFEANATGATSDPVLSLYTAGGETLLATSDNRSDHDSGATLHWTPAQDGMLTYTVKPSDPALAGNAVTYTTRVSEALISHVPYIRK